MSALALLFAIRVGGGLGTLEEITWTAPAIDVVASSQIGTAYAAISLGYSELDNNTYLADGRAIRLAIAGGVALKPCLRIAGVVDVEQISFHADPDVLDAHPGVDILATRGGLIPTAGIEGTHRITDYAAVGVFARAALRKVELFDVGAVHERARLVQAGAFLELRLH